MQPEEMVEPAGPGPGFALLNRGIVMASLLAVGLLAGLNAAGLLVGRLWLYAVLGMVGYAAGLVVGVGREDAGEPPSWWAQLDALLVTALVGAALYGFAPQTPTPELVYATLAFAATAQFGARAGLEMARAFLEHSEISGRMLGWARGVTAEIGQPYLRFCLRVLAQTLITAVLLLASVIIIAMFFVETCAA